jgi:hypothetical protein
MQVDHAYLKSLAGSVAIPQKVWKRLWSETVDICECTGLAGLHKKEAVAKKLYADQNNNKEPYNPYGPFKRLMRRQPSGIPTLRLMRSMRGQRWGFIRPTRYLNTTLSDSK